MKAFSILFLITGMAASAQQVPVGEILASIDRNMNSETRVFTSKMIIHGRRGDRTVESKTWTSGNKKSFTEYLFPVRDQGTKMLKLEDQLWIYSPSTDRVIQIAGHMLRQSVMGSDLSYEDMMEDRSMAESYSATLAGTENIGDRKCWVLNLVAKDPDMAYQGMKLWVDIERRIPLKQEFYAKSGTLLKRTELSDVVNLQGRWFPRKIVFKDVLKEGAGTEFIITDIKFNVQIQESVFSKGNLKK